MFERVQSARGGLALLAACAALLAGCDNGNGNVTCSGTGCPAVSGQYLFTLSAPVHCAAWQVGTLGSSYMNVQSSDGQLSVTLFSTETHPHFLTGTLSSGGGVSVAETQQLQVLGLPIASVGGAFSPAQGSGPPFRFRGTLTLTPTAVPPAATATPATAGLPAAGTPAGTAIPAAGTPVPSSTPAAGTPVSGLTPVSGTEAPAATANGLGAEDLSDCSGTVLLNAEQVTTATVSTTQSGTTTTTTTGGTGGTTGSVGTTGASGLR